MTDGLRRFSREFKLSAVHRMDGCGNVCALARELGVKRKLLYQWRDRYRQEGEAGLRGRGRPRRGTSPPPPQKTCLAREGAAAGSAPEAVDAALAAAQRRIAELERKIGQQELDLDFFQRALRRVGAPRPASGGNGAMAFTPSSKP